MKTQPQRRRAAEERPKSPHVQKHNTRERVSYLTEQKKHKTPTLYESSIFYKEEKHYSLPRLSRESMRAPACSKRLSKRTGCVLRSLA